MNSAFRLLACGVAVACVLQGAARFRQDPGGASFPAVPLVPDTTGMETAWDVPRNPLADSLPLPPLLAEEIRKGFRIFTNTPVEAAAYAANEMSCNNCHLNAGQRERAMPLAGIAAIYPEYNKRSGRLFSLEDRIVECFKRSINASSPRRRGGGAVPGNDTPEVLALSAYFAWLSGGFPHGQSPPWRGRNTIPPSSLIPPEKFNPVAGGELYAERCSNCHGEDGQGVFIGDKKPGPLWGDGSWNDGAGAARVYTLAGMIRYSMPYMDPQGLTDEEAQQIAAFINSKPRPEYPFKNNDYPGSKPPPDAVYYRK